jgi:hypothetical protein
MNFISQLRKERLRAIKVLVSFTEFLDSAEEESEIIFNASVIADVSGLLEVIDRSSIFNKGPVSVIGVSFRSV